VSTTPAKTEAEAGPVEFAFDGETYTIAPAAEWDLDVMERVEDGKVTTAVRELLGPGQWKTFRSKPRKVADMGAMFATIEKALGVEGN
jgi:hypothetical protein